MEELYALYKTNNPVSDIAEINMPQMLLCASFCPFKSFQGRGPNVEHFVVREEARQMQYDIPVDGGKPACKFTYFLR